MNNNFILVTAQLNNLNALLELSNFSNRCINMNFISKPNILATRTTEIAYLHSLPAHSRNHQIRLENVKTARCPQRQRLWRTRVGNIPCTVVVLYVRGRYIYFQSRQFLELYKKYKNERLWLIRQDFTPVWNSWPHCTCSQDIPFWCFVEYKIIFAVILIYWSCIVILCFNLST